MVDPAVRGGHRGDGLLDGGRVADVDDAGLGPPAGLGDRGGHGLELVLLDVDEDDRGALGGEVAGDRLADPLRGAGDDGDPSFEALHAAAPLRACS